MSSIDGIKPGKSITPLNPLSFQQASPNGGQAVAKGGTAPSDGSNISSEAKKNEPSGEKRDLLDGLKSNFGGGDRIQTSEKKLAKLSTDQLKSVKRKREFDKAPTKLEEDHHEVAADLARSGPLYETEVGEDGETYRKSGKVMIDTGTEEDDEKTVKKMKQVKAAALAPDGNQLAPLSEQDKKVAGEATEKGKKAQLRLDAKAKGGPAPDSAKKDDGKQGGSTF